MAANNSIADKLNSRLQQDLGVMHFQVVLFGDACNGQSSMFSVLRGQDEIPTSMHLEPEAKEMTVHSDGKTVKLTLLDAGDGIMAAEEDKACFKSTHLFVLVLDVAGDLDTALDNAEDRWFPVVADAATSPHMIICASKVDLLSPEELAARMLEVNTRLRAALQSQSAIKMHSVIETSAFTKQGVAVRVAEDHSVYPIQYSLLGQVVKVLSEISFCE